MDRATMWNFNNTGGHHKQTIYVINNHCPKYPSIVGLDSTYPIWWEKLLHNKCNWTASVWHYRPRWVSFKQYVILVWERKYTFNLKYVHNIIHWQTTIVLLCSLVVCLIVLPTAHEWNILKSLVALCIWSCACINKQKKKKIETNS